MRAIFLALVLTLASAISIYEPLPLVVQHAVYSVSSVFQSATKTLTINVTGGGSIAGWTQIPNTTLIPLCPTYAEIQGASGCSAVESAWGSMAIDNTRNEAIIHGGGHSDYFGNEIYSINFNTSPVTISLLKDATHGANLTGPGSNAEANADGTPNARHDYNGWWYLPNRDNFFLYGAGLSTIGNFTDGNWAYTVNAGTWTNLAPSTHPNTSSNGSVPQMALNDSNYGGDGCLYFLENNVPNFWKQCRDSLSFSGTNNWTALTGPAGAPCATTNPSATIDISRQKFVCAGGGFLYSIDLASSATVNDTGASGCSALANATSPGMAYDPVQKLVVAWFGGSNVVTYNATARTCATVSFTGGPGAQLSNGTFNRFAYMPGIGKFVLANGMSSNVWTLQMTDTATAANTDFANRSAGAAATQSFDAAATYVPVGSGFGCYTSTETNPVSAFPNCIRDTSVFRSGGASMNFHVAGLAGDRPAGFTIWSFGSAALTPNTTTYIQFAQRVNSHWITDQPAATPSGTTYPKQFIMNYTDGGTGIHSCDNPDIVMVNSFSRNYVQGYYGCGAVGFQMESTLGTGLFDEFNQTLVQSGTFAFNPGGADFKLTGGTLDTSQYNCQHGTSQPNFNCFNYVPNQWVTYLVRVDMGTFGTANSRLIISVSTPQAPAYRQILYVPNLTISQDNAAFVLNSIQFMPYWTGRDGTQNACSGGGSCFEDTWYDELIVSRNFIPAPAAPPAVP